MLLMKTNSVLNAVKSLRKLRISLKTFKGEANGHNLKGIAETLKYVNYYSLFERFFFRCSPPDILDGPISGRLLKWWPKSGVK